MPDQPSQLILTLDAGWGADNQELAELGQRLRKELLELDAAAVERVRGGAAPTGSKGDAAALATLAITLAPLVLTELMKTLQTFLSRHERATVTVKRGKEEVTVTGSPSKEQLRAIDAFVRNHKA